jgi:hypothetical protein
MLFEMQVDGVGRQEISSKLVGESIIDVFIPSSQSTESLWFARIALSSGMLIELTSSSTSTKDWKEYGTINLRLVPAKDAEELSLSKLMINTCCIEAVTILDFVDSDCIAEAGIAFELDAGGELVALAGGAPGSFAIRVRTERNAVEHPMMQAGVRKRPISEHLE